MEIITFYRLDENSKNLLILNLPSLSEDILYNFIHEQFSKFGLIFEIQILQNFASRNHNISENINGFRAYVKFYSSNSAAYAKSSLEKNLLIDNSLLKILFANRKTIPTKTLLYYTKCYDLANYYIGFNKWSIRNVKFETETCNTESQSFIVSNCQIELYIISEDLSSYGSAIVKHPFQNQYQESKSIAYCMSKKRSYQKAIEDVFSKVIFVDYYGKIYIDICAQQNEDFIDETDILTVNEMDIEKYSSEEEDALEELLLVAQQIDDLEVNAQKTNSSEVNVNL